MLWGLYKEISAGGAAPQMTSFSAIGSALACFVVLETVPHVFVSIINAANRFKTDANLTEEIARRPKLRKFISTFACKQKEATA